MEATVYQWNTSIFHYSMDLLINSIPDNTNNIGRSAKYRELIQIDIPALHGGSNAMRKWLVLVVPNLSSAKPQEGNPSNHLIYRARPSVPIDFYFNNTLQTLSLHNNLVAKFRAIENNSNIKRDP